MKELTGILQHYVCCLHASVSRRHGNYSVLFLSSSVTNFVLFPFIALFVVLMKLLMHTYCNKSLMLSTNKNTNLPELYAVIIFFGYLQANV